MKAASTSDTPRYTERYERLLSLAAVDIRENRRQDETRSVAATKPQGQAARCVKEKTDTADLIILCSDESTPTVVSHMYCLPSMRPPPDVHIGSPTELMSHLAGRTVTLCAIGLLASDLKETALKNNWERSVYADLLTAASGAVETKVAIIICSDRSMVSPNEETAITNRINLILGDKGIILWWKENKSSHFETKIPRRACLLNPSLSVPDNGAAKRSMGFNAHRVNPEACSLRLKTRLRYGTISYRHGDVEKRLEGWTPPTVIVDDLMKKWKSTADAELLIYLENETGRDLVVVNEVPKTTQVTGSLKDVLQNITPGASFLHPFTGKRRASSSSNDMGPD